MSYANPLKALRRVCDRRGFRLWFSTERQSIVIRNRQGMIILIGAHQRPMRLITAARAYLRKHHHRLPGAPKGNRNARRENRRAA